jgi:hypothetical protein
VKGRHHFRKDARKIVACEVDPLGLRAHAGQRHTSVGDLTRLEKPGCFGCRRSVRCDSEQMAL